MKALIFNQTGDPAKVLSLKEINKPTPAPGEVLIKVVANPVNPTDSFFIQGNYRFKPGFPQTAGLEGAGIIEATGGGVTLPVGALVAFSGTGTWAEYVTLNVDAVIPLPEDFPTEKAAQFFLNPSTAWGLLNEAKVKPGGRLLLTAANSTVSRIIIQLARLRNIQTIGVVRNLNQSQELKELGATEVLLQDQHLSDHLHTITNGEGIDAALDAVGGETGVQILKSLKAKGRLIIYGLLSKEPVHFHNSLIIFKNLVIKGFGIRGYMQNQTADQRKQMTQSLIDTIKKSSFRLPVDSVFSFDQFKDALAAEKKEGRKGKIIFCPAEKDILSETSES